MITYKIKIKRKYAAKETFLFLFIYSVKSSDVLTKILQITLFSSCKKILFLQCYTLQKSYINYTHRRIEIFHAYKNGM